MRAGDLRSVPIQVTKVPHAWQFARGDHLLALQQKRAVWGVRFNVVDGLSLRNLSFGELAGAAIAGEVRPTHRETPTNESTATPA